MLVRMQERALHLVYWDCKISSEELLDQAKLHSLHIGRLKSPATGIYKAAHGRAPPHVSSLFTKGESDTISKRQFSNITPL